MSSCRIACLAGRAGITCEGTGRPPARRWPARRGTVLDDADEFIVQFPRSPEVRVEQVTDGSIPTIGDVAFYRDTATETEGPALEVGVDTGRISLKLHASGLDVELVDRSTDVLERTHGKPDRRGIEPSVRRPTRRRWSPNATTSSCTRPRGRSIMPSGVGGADTEGALPAGREGADE